MTVCPSNTYTHSLTHSLGVVLITDAMAAMGLPDGDHMLGTMSVELLNGTARLAGKSTLAGR